jgi:hypothetical protein
MYVESFIWADSRKHPRVQNGMQSGRMYAMSGAYCAGRDWGGCSFLWAPTYHSWTSQGCVCVSHMPQFKHLNHPDTHTHTSGTPHTLHNSEFHTQTYQHCSMGSQLNLVTA